MNTQNVNGKTATRKSTERWDERILRELDALQGRASLALFRFQTSANRTALHAQAGELMLALQGLVSEAPHATPEIQEKVNMLAEMLNVMADMAASSSQK